MIARCVSRKIEPTSNATLPQEPHTCAGPGALTKLCSDSIGEALTDLLGNHAKEAIFNYMEKTHSVARNEISEHLSDLFALFEQTFGIAGKNVIGRAFAKKIYSKLGWEFEPIQNFQFVDYLETIRARIGREALDSTRLGSNS